MTFVDPRTMPFVPLRSRGELPHLHKPAGIYFVTFRLADAVLPAGRRVSHVPKMDDVDPDELMRDYDPPLTLGRCALKRPEVASVVQNAIVHFEGDRYALIAWCVMPNHVHIIVAPYAGHTLERVMHSWKSFTAKEANRLLGTTGTFWERESFDHLARSAQSVERFAKYVEQNPVAAGLCERAQDWPYSSAGAGFKSSIWSREA